MEKSKELHYMIFLQERGDERGGLAVIEGAKDFPFEIKRVFYEYNMTNDVTRGNHANIDSRFGFVSIAGSCCVEIDDGNQCVEYILDSPLKLLFADKMVWKVMKNFTQDNILLIVSDQHYNKNEYINDYEEFKVLSKGGRQ